MRNNAILNITFIFLLIANLAIGQDCYYGDLRGDAIQPNATFVVEDNQFPSFTNVESTQKVRNLVVLEIDHSDTSVIDLGDSIVVDLEINLEYAGGLSLIASTSLGIGYDTTATNRSQNKAFQFYEDAHRMTVEILNVRVISAAAAESSPTQYPLILSGEIYVERLYNFNQSIAPTFSNADHEHGNLSLGWSDVQGAEEYDVEWTFYDSLSVVGNEILNNSTNTYLNFDWLYECNATRITTDKNFFEIPLLYPNGFIFYRVRSVRYNEDGIRETSTWSSTLSNGTLSSYSDQYQVPWHEFNLNWQAQTSFAEEGKNVPSVRYFDGSLRERQAVTFSNAIGMSIAEQTIYDHQGRPAVSVMAAPTFIDSIAYDAYFATTNSGNPYNKNDFDIGDCTVFPDSMSSNTGAANYYSSQNQKGTERFNKYIPKAEGYPFTVTEYMPDLTGRIKKQSGVGATFRMGGGHETQYFYGKPSQQELDRLFGNDVGDAAHYFKNMVKDANGQVSISYVDAHGRTIGTALAGSPPSNVDDLEAVDASFNAVDVVTQGLEENFKQSILKNVEGTFDLTATHSLLVAVESDYTFKYSSDSVIYKQDCLPANVCYDCAYDVNIRITDNCGNLFNGGMPFDTTIANITVFDTTVNSSGFDFEVTFTDLPVGEYQVTKSLTISQAALDTYVADFMNRETCLPSLDDLIQQFIDSTDFSGCNIEYEDCLTQVGSVIDLIEEFRADIIASGEEFEIADSLEVVALHEQLLAECENLNTTYVECDNLNGLLLIDVSPSGQYATYEIDNDGMFSVSDASSILRSINDATYDYEFQKCFNEALSLGIIDQIDTLFLDDGFKTLDQLTPTELIENWQSEWAIALRVCHPEYECLDNWCANASNSDFDNKLYNLETYTDALMMFPDLGKDAAALLDADPFFMSGTPEYDSMFVRLTNISPNESCFQVSLYDMLASAAYCGGNLNCQTLFGEGCDRDNNFAWALYRQYYLGLKEEYKSYGTNETIGLSIVDRDPTGTEINNLNSAGVASGITNPNHIAAGQSFNPTTDSIPINTTAAKVTRAYDLGMTPMLDACVDSVQLCIDWDFSIEQNCTFTGGESQVSQFVASISLMNGNTVVNYQLNTGLFNGGCFQQYGLDTCIVLAASDFPNTTFMLDLSVGSATGVFFWRSQKVDITAFAINKTTGGCETTCVVPTGKMPRLVSSFAGNIPNTVEAFESKSDSLSMELELQCDTFCINNANAWIAILESGCTVLEGNTSLRNRLRKRLIAVCQAGCDVDHPFGASTTPLGVMTDSSDVSFAQIIEDLLGGGVCNADCNANAITFPAPYENPYYHGTIETSFVAYSEDCLCENLSDFQNDYQNNNQGFASFTAYLNQFADEKLFESEVDSLLAYCDGSSGCSTLDQSIILPPYLECEVCKTCDEVTQAEMDFDATCTESDSTIREQLRAQYLNQRFGFDLLPSEYNAFLGGGCSGTIDVLCPASPFSSARIDTTCYGTLVYQAQLNAVTAYENLLDSIRQNFIDEYLSTCLDNLQESFDAIGDLQEYHYTLYYYDQANNLIQTVPPNGVQPLDVAQLEQVDDHRDNGTGSAIYPNHTFLTTYEYNTLNQVVFQDSPDADSTRFWYDEVGRLIASQDGRQRPLNLYSYTLRDPLGRTEEVGEISQTTAMTDAIARSATSFNDWIGNGSKRQITKTTYDEVSDVLMIDNQAFVQENLRPRVARVTLDENGDGTYDYATHYSYDITGNVKTLIQEIVRLDQFGQRYKRIDYDYDYISGNVHKVYYQRGQRDQFTYRYEYDENNRLIATYTSLVETYNNDSPLWEKDATNEYYLHGPLARMEVGDQRVQGCDYAYTLQGWMKGINSSIINVDRDMGGDGRSATGAAKDALSFTIGYYEGDYQQISGTSFELGYVNTSFGNASPSLYNGNIRHIAMGIAGLEDIGYTYTYDQLHRLKDMVVYDQISSILYSWSVGSAEVDYRTTLGYDPNGNIMRLTRRGNNSRGMDDLRYRYNAGTNQLQYVDDAIFSSFFDDDIDDQSANNYAYDGAGNLKQDNQSGVSNIQWTVYGKVLEVERSSNRTTTFGYDAAQNRVYKELEANSNLESATYYIRDAQGNTMAIYREVGDTDPTLTWTEQYLYGSSRMGVYQPNILMETDTTQPFYTNTRKLYEGDRLFELTNHLGNVLATINDRRRGIDNNSDDLVDFYEAVVINTRDYYPFGAEMPGRTFSSGSESYRFGFNGKEADKSGEWGGLTHYDYGFRIYNPAIGKFLSVDPLARDYPAISPYVYVVNNPVLLIDPDGREPILPLVGTIQQAIDFYRENGFNSVYDIDRFYETRRDRDGNRLDTYVRYVYTEQNGWIDLRHYFGTVIRNELTMDALELVQCAGGLASCYSYEDLPSNDMGGKADAYISDINFSPFEDRDHVPRTGEELYSGVLQHFGDSGATTPEDAPNYDVLPIKERPKVPTHDLNDIIARTPEGAPIYRKYSLAERKELIKTGKYVPQNKTQSPYDLDNFPTPAPEYRETNENGSN